MGFDQGLSELVDHLRLGFDFDVDAEIIGLHSSKSQELPIVASHRAGWSTSVAWYAYNFHNYYSAFRFEKALPATLLWPIAGKLGRKHNSGHEHDCPLPDITNFEKDYWNRRPYEGFASFAGGWSMMTTLRYLESVSKIDQKALFDLLFDKTRYGAMDVIDGNAFDYKALTEVVGIPRLDTYDKDVAVYENPIIEAMRVDWHGVWTNIRPGCVEIRVKPGVLLPAHSAVSAGYVDLRDTRLGEHVDERHQVRWDAKLAFDAPLITNFVPVHIFRYHRPPDERFKAERARLLATPYSAWSGYGATSFDARLFRFEVPNALDAVLFVKWWLEAAIPCAEAMLRQKETTHAPQQEG